MIILDTHIWVWWVHGDERLSQTQAEVTRANEADQMIVATARVHGCPLVTSDRKLLDYPHVETVA